jgi:hypothetical protein
MAKLLVQSVRVDMPGQCHRFVSQTIVRDAPSPVRRLNILMAVLASHAVVKLGEPLGPIRLVPSIRVIAAKLATIVTAPVALSVLSTLTR